MRLVRTAMWVVWSIGVMGCASKSAEATNPAPQCPPAPTCPECPKPVDCAKAQAAADERVPLADKDLIGTWNVTYEAEFSSCSAAAQGDKRQRQWLVGEEQGQYKLKVLGGDPNEPALYTGFTGSLGEGAPPRAVTQVTLNSADVAGSGIQVWMKQKKHLMGRRIVGCTTGAILYTVTASRTD